MRCHYDLVHAQRVPLRYHAQHPNLGDYVYELGVSYNTRTGLAHVRRRVTYGPGCENGWVEKIDVDRLRSHPQLRPEDEHARNLRDAARRRQERRQSLEAYGNWASGAGTSASPSTREPSGPHGAATAGWWSSTAERPGRQRWYRQQSGAHGRRGRHG